MKLSIITATYNSRKTLERCLRSVKNQSAINYIEHIVIDGASNDSTLEIVADFPHIEKVISEKDNGIFDAFNKGLREASGEFVYYLNSDDWLLSENIIERILGKITTETNFICAKVMMQDDLTKAKWMHNPRIFEFKDKKYPLPNHQGFFLRRNWLLKKNGFNESYTIAADTEVMIEAMLTSRGEFLDFPIACFEHGGMSTGVENILVIREQLNEIFIKYGVNFESVDEPGHLQKNIKHLKNIIYQFLSDQPIKKIFNKKEVGIIGTGQLAVILSKFLEFKGCEVKFYVTSEAEPNYFNEKPVYRPEYVPESSVIINSIEGEHYRDLNLKILRFHENAVIFRWFEIFNVS